MRTPFDESPICEVCGKDPASDCDCKKCQECGEAGNPKYKQNGGKGC